MPSSPLVSTDLVSWDASYALSGGFSGSAEFTNQNLQYGVDLLWTVVSISLNTTVTSDLVDSSMFEGDILWFRGVVHSVDDGCGDASKEFKINVASFYSTLVNKAINTHFYDTTAGTALLDVLQVYCGIPVGIISIVAGAAPPVRAIVQGANVWEECLKLSQCCHSDLFIQVGGILTVAPWKDHNSSVDLVLPVEAVFRVTRVRSSEKGPSRIRVRGRAASRYDCGPHIISTGPLQEPTKITKDKCYKNGLGEPSSELVLKNLGGSKASLVNASYLLSGDNKFDSMDSSQISEASVTINTIPSVGTYVSPATNSVTTYKVLSRSSKTGELSNNTVDLRQQKSHLKVHDKALAKLAGVPPGVFSISGKDPQLGGEAGDRSRMEMIINDLDLQSEFGIVTEEIDNPYISSGVNALFIGIRKIQEFLMGRNTYKLLTPYLPTLQINQVITFTVPDTLQQITGRISLLHVAYSADTSEVTMEVTVESFSEFAGRTYLSGNLLVYPELCGINQVNWISTGGVYALSGYFGFEAGASVYQPLMLVSGLIFTFTAEVKLVSTLGSFKVEETSSGTSVTVTASGTITLVFTPLATSGNLVFTALSGEWFLTLPTLVTTVTT